jgi:hypothetical protein
LQLFFPSSPSGAPLLHQHFIAHAAHSIFTGAALIFGTILAYFIASSIITSASGTSANGKPHTHLSPPPSPHAVQLARASIACATLISSHSSHLIAFISSHLIQPHWHLIWLHQHRSRHRICHAPRPPASPPAALSHLRRPDSEPSPGRHHSPIRTSSSSSLPRQPLSCSP